jgi:hypothetical protein
MRQVFGILVVWMSLYATCLLGAQSEPQQTESVVERARHAASEGKIAYKLTTPEDLKELLGPPINEKKDNDGGMELLTFEYPDLTARFAHMRDFAAPFTLLTLTAKGSWLAFALGQQKGGRIDIGQDRQVVLRSAADLAKFDPFWGLAALAFQTDPNITPAQVVGLWTTTATKTDVGPVVDPPKFIEAVQSRPDRKKP